MHPFAPDACGLSDDLAHYCGDFVSPKIGAPLGATSVDLPNFGDLLGGNAGEYTFDANLVVAR